MAYRLALLLIHIGHRMSADALAEVCGHLHDELIEGNERVWVDERDCAG